MKKTYVKPESSLMILNFSENIVASTLGKDMISAGAIIMFTYGSGVCRQCYENDQSAPVRADLLSNPNATFNDYYHDMRTYGSDVYFNCFIASYDTSY